MIAPRQRPTAGVPDRPRAGQALLPPQHTSKLSCAGAATPSFDADLFDFYLSLPPEHRVNAQVMRHALNHLNPALALFHRQLGIAACFAAYKTAWLIGRKLLRHLTGNERFKAPALEDRTWPNREQYLRGHANLVAEFVRPLASSELEAALPFLDWGKLTPKPRLGWPLLPAAAPS